MNLLKELPAIRRARGYRLYSQNNDRILDLYRDNGAALAGYRQGSALLYLKNTLSKGLLLSYPSVYLHQVKKAALKLVPKVDDVVVFSSILSAKQALQAASLKFATLTPSEYMTTLSAEKQAIGVFLTTPFLPGSSSPCAVLLTKEQAEKHSTLSMKLEDDIVSPCVLSASARSLYDLVSFLPEARKLDFGWFHSSLFDRNGWELSWKGTPDDYPAFFRKTLENGLLFSPSIEICSLLPFECTEGEKSLILKAVNGE